MPTTRRGAANRKVHGTRKHLEIQRSILPSTRRKGARDDLRFVHRVARRAIRTRLGMYRGPAADVLDAALDERADLTMWPQHRIRDIVVERREADKLSQLYRWAHAYTEHLPQEDRLPALRAAFPATTVSSRHALSHLEWDEDLCEPYSEAWWIYQRRAMRRRELERVSHPTRSFPASTSSGGTTT